MRAAAGSGWACGGASGASACSGGSGVPIAAPATATHPAYDFGRGLLCDDPSIRHALAPTPPSASAFRRSRGGVLGTSADFDVLKDGVSDLAEGLDNRIKDFFRRFITEIDRVFDENRRSAHRYA